MERSRKRRREKVNKIFKIEKIYRTWGRYKWLNLKFFGRKE